MMHEFLRRVNPARRAGSNKGSQKPLARSSPTAMNQLDQLKSYTTVVADTGNFLQLAQFAPRDATTNPSLILKAVQSADYAHLLHDTVAAHKSLALDEIVDQVLVRFGLEILKVVPGRVSTEVDA